MLSVIKILCKDEGGECLGSVTNKGTAEIAFSSTWYLLLITFFLVTGYCGLHISFEWQSFHLLVLATNAMFANEE